MRQLVHHGGWLFIKPSLSKTHHNDRLYDCRQTELETCCGRDDREKRVRVLYGGTVAHRPTNSAACRGSTDCERSNFRSTRNGQGWIRFWGPSGPFDTSRRGLRCITLFLPFSVIWKTNFLLLKFEYFLWLG